MSLPDMILYYKSVIRSILEYSAPVWHSSITIEQSNSLEMIQKRALRIMYPHLTYMDALEITGLIELSTRHVYLCMNMAMDIESNNRHPTLQIPTKITQ